MRPAIAAMLLVAMTLGPAAFGAPAKKADRKAAADQRKVMGTGLVDLLNTDRGDAAASSKLSPGEMTRAARGLGDAPAETESIGVGAMGSRGGGAAASGAKGLGSFKLGGRPLDVDLGGNRAASARTPKPAPASAETAPKPPPPAEGAIGRVKDLPLGDVAERIIAFESEPTGASVTVDGRRICDATPCSRAVKASGVDVSMALAHYDSATTWVSPADRAKTLRLELKPTFGTIAITSDQPGVRVTLDGAPVGVTPLEVKADAGLRSVLVADRCYQELGERVAVERAQKRTVALKAVPRWSGVKVRARDRRGNDIEAKVEVDGKALGVTPLTAKVSVCASLIRVVANGRRVESRLALEEDKVTELVAAMDDAAAASPPDAKNRRNPSSRWTAEPTFDGSKLEVVRSVRINSVAEVPIEASRANPEDPAEEWRTTGRFPRGGATDLSLGDKRVSLTKRSAPPETELPMDDVNGVIRSHWPEVKRCAAGSLPNYSRFAGTLEIYLLIDATGVVDEARVDQSSLPNQAAEDCVIREARTWRFPPPNGGGSAEVNYTFIFGS